MPLLLLATLTATIVFYWFRSHPLTSWESGILIFSPIGVAVGILLMTAFRLRKATIEEPLLIRPILTLPAFIFFALVPYNIATFLPAFLSPTATKLGWLPWIVANTTVVEELFLLILVLSVTLLILYATGRIITRMLRIPIGIEPSIFHFSVVTAIGTITWSITSLFLGIIGMWTAPIILTLSTIALIATYASIRKLIRATLHPFPIRYRAIEFWSIGILFLSLGLMAVEALRPIPTGFDDMTYYANRVHLMMERQVLIPGGPAFPFEALQATLGIALDTKLLMYPLALNLLFVMLAGLAIYGFGRDFLGRRTGTVAAALWIALPMTAALAVREVKPDILLSYIATLTIWLSISWFENRKEMYRLKIASLLFGFALSIKLTAVILFAPLMLLIGIALWKKYIVYHQFLLLLISVLIPLLPWIGYGAATAGASWPTSVATLTYSTPRNAVLQQEMWGRLGIDPASCAWTSAAEDQSAYDRPGDSLINLLTLPWDLTLNNRVGTPIAEVGILFLALLPAFLIWRKTVAQSVWVPMGLSRRSVLIVLASTYFATWVIVGKNMPWYGFAGLFFPILLIAALLIHAWDDRRVTVTLWLIAMLATVLGLSVHIRSYGNEARLWYAGNLITAEGFTEMTFPGFEGAADTINTSPDSLVLATATKFTYFIKDNDTRVIYDGLLDTFSCIDTGNDDMATLDRLREGDIHYIFFSKYLDAFERSEKITTLARKVGRFQDFATKNLLLEDDGVDYRLYVVPAP